MAQYAEQHFVPKFYLRNFSDDGRQLNLVNVKSNRPILGASLRKQCARTKFYDFDADTEATLGKLEDRTAPIIRRVIETDSLPDRGWDVASHITLLLFVVVQHVRGINTANANDEMTDYYAKLMLHSRFADKNIDHSKVKIRNKYPAAIPLTQVPHVMPLALALKAHLIVNRSPVELITSDDPVVLHNQYCEGIDYHGVLGWKSRGFQVFLPLSPHHLLVLYDDRIYRMGSRKSHLSTAITDPTEINQLNSMQVLHAVSSVYFKTAADGESVSQLVLKHVKDRPKRRITIVETGIIDKPDGTGSSLVHHYEPLLRCKLKLTGIRYQGGVTNVRLHERSQVPARSADYWAKQKSGTRYEVTKVIGAYDEIG